MDNTKEYGRNGLQYHPVGCNPLPPHTCWEMHENKRRDVSDDAKWTPFKSWKHSDPKPIQGISHVTVTRHLRLLRRRIEGLMGKLARRCDSRNADLARRESVALWIKRQEQTMVGNASAVVCWLGWTHDPRKSGVLQNKVRKNQQEKLVEKNNQNILADHCAPDLSIPHTKIPVQMRMTCLTRNFLPTL